MESPSISELRERSTPHTPTRESDEAILDWIPRRGRWVGPGAVLLGFLVGLWMGLDVSGLLGKKLAAPVAAPPPVASATAAAPSPAPAPAPQPVAEPAPVAQDPAPARPAHRRPARANDGSGQALLEVEIASDPTGAAVWLEGKKLGETPLTAFLPATRSTTLQLTKEGRAPARVVWTAEQGSTVQVQLTEAP